MKLIRTITVASVILLCLFTLPQYVNAESAETYQSDFDADMSELIKESGAEGLPENLPDEAYETLRIIGIGDVDVNALLSLDFKTIINTILSTFKEKITTPAVTLGIIISAVMLNVFLDAAKTPMKGNQQESTFMLISAIVICAGVAIPLYDTVNTAVEAMKSCGTFCEAYIPIFASIIISSGGSVSAGAYQIAAITATQIVFTLAENIVAPLIASFMALSIACSAAPELSLDALTANVKKIAVWVLTVSTSLFVGFMSLQSFITGSTDGMANKALRFIISSSIPAVGGALGDALGSVQGSVKILRSAVGVYGIIAMAAVLLPVLAEVALWIFSFNIGVAVSDLFGASKVSSMLKSFSNGVSLLMATLLCTLVALTFSSAVMLSMTG